MESSQFVEIKARLDEIISLLKQGLKPLPLGKRILEGVVTIISLLSILSIIDIIKLWIGG
jgi:hypothetical protein